jgi:dihydrofolate synthase/folylpolyglutamate synthase
VDEAFDVDLMVQLALARGISAEPYPQPEAALNAARLRRKKDELILVAGSLFLVAAIRELLLSDTDQLKIII